MALIVSEDLLFESQRLSIIVALISGINGVVSSDGRLFNPARLVDGQLTEPARISSEAFDKTFAIYNGNVIGAFAGLMHFSGKIVADYISDIALSHSGLEPILAPLAETVREEMSARLLNIDPKEVMFACRKLDLLLVGRRNITRAEMGIVSIRFSPQGEGIVSEEDTVWADRGKQFYVRGEDRAKAAAARVLDADRASNCDIIFLKGLAQKAVRAGIAATGTHPYGADPACGGKVFTKRTRYL